MHVLRSALLCCGWWLVLLAGWWLVAGAGLV